MKCKGFKGRVHSKPERLLFLLLLLPALAILLVPFLHHSKDMAGWIEIPDTDFSYPVMQSGKEGHREDTETGSRGQLSNMGYYEGKYDYSEEGQRDFMIELINGIKCVNDGRCVGSLYWDPIMVAGDGIGWSFKEYDDKVDSNVISNTTWFDFDHKALKVFAAYKYN